MQTLGLVANVYQEANALPGWLEAHLPYFDDMRVLHAGPQGAHSDDGTLEILEQHRIPVEFCAIDDGFGVVRTKAVRMSPCDWVMLLDADERFHATLPVLTCAGESTPPEIVDSLLYDYGNPNYDNDGPRDRQVIQDYDKSIDFDSCPSNFENMRLLGAKLLVTESLFDKFNHVRMLRTIIENDDIDAVKTIRRHWHDLGFGRPTQNWHTDPDYQIRIVRNNGKVGWDETRMHERLVGANNIYQPNHTNGPFFDHYHLYYKEMEAAQRQHDIRIYCAIAEGKVPPLSK